MSKAEIPGLGDGDIKEAREEIDRILQEGGDLAQLPLKDILMDHQLLDYATQVAAGRGFEGELDRFLVLDADGDAPESAPINGRWGFSDNGPSLRSRTDDAPRVDNEGLLTKLRKLSRQQG